MASYSELMIRIDRVFARAEDPRADSALLSDIEDVLAEGYVHALAEEARSRRLETRLDDLVGALDEPGAAVEARRVAWQRRSLDLQIRTLRARLATVREHFIRLGGGQSARV